MKIIGLHAISQISSTVRKCCTMCLGILMLLHYYTYQLFNQGPTKLLLLSTSLCWLNRVLRLATRLTGCILKIMWPCLQLYMIVCAGCCPLAAAQYPSNRESRTDHRFNLAALAGPLPISPVSSALPLVNRVDTLLFTEPDGLIVPFACT